MEWGGEFARKHSLPADYAEVARNCVKAVAERVSKVRESSQRTVVVGISGAQGAGKTTFAQFLAAWLEQEMQLTAACLSLDDFYLRKAERKHLGREVHPLLETRGVPGTHDVQLAQQALDELTGSDSPRVLAVPAFDKARDDRAPEEEWRRIDLPVNIVLFEGWCVGARPQSTGSLKQPVNSLESERDRTGRWRRHVNERLETDYADLFGRLDLLLMLRIPSFDKVLEWRSLQERRLREDQSGGSSDSPGTVGLSHAELAHFIQHYERLTRHMLETMPAYADAVIGIDEEHRLTGITWNKPSI